MMRMFIQLYLLLTIKIMIANSDNLLKKDKFHLLLCFFGTPPFTSSSMYFDVVQWPLWWRQCVIALAGEPSPQWEAGVVSQ